MGVIYDALTPLLPLPTPMPDAQCTHHQSLTNPSGRICWHFLRRWHENEVGWGTGEQFLVFYEPIHCGWLEICYKKYTGLTCTTHPHSNIKALKLIFSECNYCTPNISVIYPNTAMSPFSKASSPVLKRHSTTFTHKDQFTCHEEPYSVRLILSSGSEGVSSGVRKSEKTLMW